MKIIHRIGLRASRTRREKLEALGVTVPPGVALPGGGDPFVAVDVPEDHANWPQIRELISKWKVPDVIRTVFTKGELHAAGWLQMVPDWHYGYPQPDEGSFGYLGVTYDISNFCSKCGIGAKQIAPFQFKDEPKWGKCGILQLNWVFDEYFVTPDVWTTVFKPHAIGKRRVMATTGTALRTVLQLVIEEEVDVQTEGLAKETCELCGRIKYLPATRGPSPPLAADPICHMAKTRQYFGSGASAHKEIIVSQQLAHAFSSAKIRGASMRPVAKRTA